MTNRTYEIDYQPIVEFEIEGPEEGNETPLEQELLPTQQFYDQLAFFTNGMVNNFVYVIFLSAAEDIVGSHLPKASVLLANIVPTLLVKLTFPYFMHWIPYRLRVWLVVGSAMFSLLCVALSTNLNLQLLAILVSSAGSGLGEITFLALSSFYQYDVVSYFSSGTGMAGVSGSLVYLACTVWFNWSSKTTLLLCSFIPLLMGWSFFRWMSHPYIQVERQRTQPTRGTYQKLESGGNHLLEGSSTGSYLSNNLEPSLPYRNPREPKTLRPEQLRLGKRVQMVRRLLVPYMVPLLLVFWIEYTINQGVVPNLLFPLELTPFSQLREHYVYYQFLYQLGVLLSRSSAPTFPLDCLYLLDLAQLGSLLILLGQATLQFGSNIYWTLGMVFVVGLFGGAVYANAFRKIHLELDGNWTEFAMGVASVADTLGITLAAFTAYFLEPSLCRYQVYHGVTLCLELSKT